MMCDFNQIDFSDGKIIYLYKDIIFLDEMIEKFSMINTLCQVEYKKTSGVYLLDIDFNCNGTGKYFFLIHLVMNNDWDNALYKKEIKNMKNLENSIKKVVSKTTSL